MTSRRSSNNTSSSNSGDPILGLDVCGKVYYCHRSTLVQNSPYFATRFQGNFDSDVSYVDERGRNVYFVERCPLSFPHIFRHLLNPSAGYPSFDKDPHLVRQLREEADFFGLAHLSQALMVTRSFSPLDGNRGVLYWLGCQKGITTQYENPYLTGAVHVGGWVDDPVKYQQKPMFEMARSASCRANFVQYQQPVTILNRGVHARTSIESYSYLLWCDHGMERLPVTIDLKSVLLRPTHYSLRVSQCYGMQGDWNFEASQDGTVWDVLHAARGDARLCLSESSDIITKLEKSLPSPAAGLSEREQQQRSEALLRLIEQDYRHTWELAPVVTQFYRYFRIIGAGSENDIRDNCLHGEGLELFGDVYED
ncbi:expressed unknown protein [Seminavis robusta]|uniref:BTB domain-containing protein n=1 Tax=Seminavis robusta TaxID=568900 RepID=A0A9N8DIN1_9STRA|nr:expressed unknown protein [Seminavis robusta]|eukprot:Sro109_g054480.1 n/a (366) ;mRNA; r:33976-35073